MITLPIAVIALGVLVQPLPTQVQSQGQGIVTWDQTVTTPSSVYPLGDPVQRYEWPALDNSSSPPPCGNYTDGNGNPFMISCDNFIVVN